MFTKFPQACVSTEVHKDKYKQAAGSKPKSGRKIRNIPLTQLQYIKDGQFTNSGQRCRTIVGDYSAQVTKRAQN